MIAEALMCMALNMYHEAKNQSMLGQVAVGQVVMNRVKDDRFPNTVCEVVKQAITYKGTNKPVIHKCQFSWYCDGKSDKIRQPKTYQKIFELSLILMNQDMIDITSGATHYHAYYVQPSWARTKTRTTKIEDHIFYKWEKR